MPHRVRAAEPLHKFDRQIPIGGEGGWDILTIDEAARGLYLSHATRGVVVDVDMNKVVGEINDLPCRARPREVRPRVR